MRKYAIGFLLVLAATSAMARDRWTGEWSGDCGEGGIQCWVAIQPVRAGYAVSWVVADRVDASRVLCRVDATAPKDSKRLVGSTSDGKTITVVIVGGGAAIRIDGIASVPCAGSTRPVAGVYSAIGD